MTLELVIVGLVSLVSGGLGVIFVSIVRHLWIDHRALHVVVQILGNSQRAAASPAPPAALSVPTAPAAPPPGDSP